MKCLFFASSAGKTISSSALLWTLYKSSNEMSKELPITISQLSRSNISKSLLMALWNLNIVSNRSFWISDNIRASICFANNRADHSKTAQGDLQLPRGQGYCYFYPATFILSWNDNGLALVQKPEEQDWHDREKFAAISVSFLAAQQPTSLGDKHSPNI